MNNLRGAKIIYQESKATQPSHLYFLQKDENYCEAIVTSESGAKRKLNIDLSNYYTKNEVDVKLLNYYTKVEINSQFSNYYTKNEVDTALALKLDKGTYTGNASDLKTEIDGKLNKGGYGGTAQDLKNSIDSKANISHTHNISDIIDVTDFCSNSSE